MLKLNIRLKLFMLSRKLILGIMVIVFILAVFATKSIYNYNNSNNQNSNIDNKIDSAITATYNTPIVTPTITPTIIPTATNTNKPELVSRGNSLRGRERKSIDDGKIIDNNEKVDFKYIDSFDGNITMYTLFPSECGWKYPGHPAYGITASGARVKPNHTIATGKQIPFGSKIRIEGFDTIYTAEDVGGAIKWNCIDIYTENRNTAFAFGRQKRKVWILSYGKSK